MTDPPHRVLLQMLPLCREVELYLGISALHPEVQDPSEHGHNR